MFTEHADLWLIEANTTFRGMYVGGNRDGDLSNREFIDRHRGGAFVRTSHGPHYWTDDTNPTLQEGPYAGAKTVNQWRADYLRDWQKRLEGL